MFSALFSGLLGSGSFRGSNPSARADDDAMFVSDSDDEVVGSGSRPTPAGKFISFKDGKLECVKLPALSNGDRKLRVVIILGKARMGKSTFLNCVAAHALKAVAPPSKTAKKSGKGASSSALSSAPAGDAFQPPFATSAEEEHCTKGMDSFLLTAEATGRSEDILLLDCQGLAMDDSSHDPALLLSAYLLGDVLIFNDQGVLKNDALKLLEPMPAFIAKLEDLQGDSSGADGLPTKPALMFRMTDAEMVKDAQANVERVLKKHADHYQSIRDSLTTMFSSVKGVCTTSLDRKEKEALTQGDGVAGTLALLAPGSDSGFRAAVDAVLSSGVPRRTAAQWAAIVPGVLAQINCGEKISLEKLDVVKLAGQVDMGEFIQKLDPHLFTDIAVDHTQATFEARVKPRAEACDKVMSQFQTRFKLLGKHLRDEQSALLLSRFRAPVDKAKAAATAAAKTAVEPHRASVQRDRPDLVLLTHTPGLSISQQAGTARAALTAHLLPLRNALTGLFKSVADPLATWADEQEERLAAALQWYEKEETATAKAAGKKAAAITKAYPGNLVAAVKDIPLHCEDELLMDRATQLRRVVEQVAMGSALWKAGPTANWLYIDISGGGVRVLAGAFKRKRGRSDLRVWRPSAKTSFDGSWAVVDPTTPEGESLDPVVAAIESQLRSRGFDMGADAQHFNPPLYRDVFAGKVSRGHALLGKLSELVVDTLLPAVQLTDVAGARPALVAACGAVRAAMDAAVDDAVYRLYEEVGVSGGSIQLLPMHRSSNVPLLLRITAPNLHPRLKLTAVDLRDPLEARESSVPIMLMSERTYTSRWLKAFELAAQAVVDDDAASSKQLVLGAALKCGVLENNQSHGPCAAVTLVQINRDMLAGGRLSYQRWTQRSSDSNSLLADLFMANLKVTLAADDAKKDVDQRIFRFWRQLGDEMAERARAREAGVAK